MLSTVFCALFTINCGIFSVQSLPLPECHEKDVNILIVADFDNLFNETKLSNVVNFFYKSRQTADVNIQISLFHSVTWETVLEFTQVKSIKDILQYFNKVNHTEKKTLLYDEQSSNIMKKLSDKVTQVLHPDVQMLIIWLAKCNDRGCDFNLGNKSLSPINYLSYLCVLVSSMEYIHIIKSFFHKILFTYGDVMFEHEDILDNMNKLSVKLCGQCSNGWITYKSLHNPYVTSCYLIEHIRNVICWYQANTMCQSIRSSLLNIESAEEMDFLKSVFLSHLTSTDHDHVVVNIGLRFKHHVHYKRLEWSNQRPLVLESDTIKNYYVEENKNTCWKLAIKLMSSQMVNVNLTSSGCEVQNADVHVCETEILDHLTYLNYIQLNKTKISPFDVNKRYLFDCGDGNAYVYYNQVCDGHINCKSGSDEKYCYKDEVVSKESTDTCIIKSKTFKGKKKVAFINKLSCDGAVDCIDGKDEARCYNCIDPACLDGQCFTKVYKDLYFTIGVKSAKHYYIDFIKCFHDRSMYIFVCATKNMDMKVDWLSKNLSAWESAPYCIYFRGRLGAPLGCPDMSNLNNCRNFTCGKMFVKCPYSYCIPSKYVKDNIKDCMYGEDEITELILSNKQQEDCLYKQKKQKTINFCDGIQDCDNNIDELDCMSCSQGFDCYAGFAQRNDLWHYVIDLSTILNQFAKVLNISYIPIINIQSFLKLSFAYLYELYMKRCNITSDLVLLDYFPHQSNTLLYRLDVSFNNIGNITRSGFLSRLKNLQFLNLECNYFLEMIEDDGIASKRIRVINLSYTRISFITSSLLNSKILEQVILHNTKIYTASWLPKGISLDVLDLRNTSINIHTVHNNDFYNALFIREALYTDNYKLCCPQVTGRTIVPHVCHSPNDVISSCDDLIGEKTKRILLWTVAMVAVVGNIIVIAYRCFFDPNFFRRTFSVFIVNLSISDLIMGIYLTIIALVDSKYRGIYVIYDTVWRTSYLCKVAGFLSALSSETSNFFILCITVDRYMVIKYPFRNYSNRKMNIAVLITWLLGLGLALCPLVITDWNIYASNGMCLGFPLTIENMAGWQYSFIVFTALNFLLFILIACGQIVICRSIFSDPNILTSEQISQRRLRDIEIAQQLFVVAMSNFLCWFPIGIIGVMSILGHSVGLDVYSWIIVFFLPLNSALNPMIYTIPFILKKLADWKRKYWSIKHNVFSIKRNAS